MAKRYVELENFISTVNATPRCSLATALAIANNYSTADVAEVKHGEWEHLGGDEWICTNCGEIITTEGSWEEPTKRYCNECGARMDVLGRRKDNAFLFIGDVCSDRCRN